ncbi:type II secretion system protein [Rickettsiales endosymbiont of Stachyamoeba lipophora]|uniref:type II secretion system protein n=1 Tax=Rickettsiales endosymbiont of Stachyamoeba lipophora TaxID=2486578 RepID=UPI000F64E3ED|nr:prepilin-type N-terminal cleavage/methylation domain-containing protein [Rickettsiales endosymbiont of Stachyamoeba lipophora]AZL15174.1 hypothetical protein EF513_01185 [Rickettsiales endosymbiont of Stachyamoeba lipophora]
MIKSYIRSLLEAKQTAFTIIELAIVMLIIGIIMGGVLAGRGMLSSARVNAIMDHATKITRAVDEFEKRYNQLPGDMYNPDVIFSANAINGNPATTRGNGDGVVSGDEGIYAFQHLALAGILEGNFNGTWNYSNLYHGPIDNSIFYFVNNYDDAIVLRFAKATIPSGVLTVAQRTGAVLTVKEMMEIDNKFDNGNPATGMIIAYTGSDAPANSCVNGGSYNSAYISSERPTCYFEMRIKRNYYSLVN